MNVPSVFISYSHDSQEHKKWVLELATRLRNNGIDAILDQFELRPGDDLPHFMETNLASCEKILMICTEKYIAKANKGQGGVGYEKMIITSNLMQNIDENKIIPLIRQNSTSDVPTFLKSKLYINFSKQDDFEYNYDDLVRTIHNSPLFEKPPVGNNPFEPIVKENLEDDSKLLNNILKIILVEQGLGNYALSKKVIDKLNISPVLFMISIEKLITKDYVHWFYGNSKEEVFATKKGMNYAYENQLIE